ncbi:MAG: peptidoglycan DD-metalloendopeptidase family protein [Pseudomonadota bacterium]
MRGWRGFSNHSTVSRLGLILAVAGLAAGCSASNVRLGGQPLFAANNQSSPIPLAPIESANLSAPGMAALSQTTTSPSLLAKGYTVENAPTVDVSSADTAQTLSQGFGVPVDIILEANGLIVPADVRAGQRLIIPVKVQDQAQVAALAPNTQVAPPAPAALGAPQTLGAPQALGAQPSTLNDQAAERRHRVQPGDTLWSVASAYGAAPQDVARLNSLPSNGSIVVGQLLRIPKAPAAALNSPPAIASPAPATTAAPAAPAPTTVAAVAPTAVVAAPATTVSVEPQATKAVVAPADATGSAFRWPVRGRIIVGFGKQADGDRNDGINLAVPAGTPVKAAEAGTVIYAGNELEGYGNLVLVQHADDWVSAYAHNETLKVSRGDKVTRGQSIASVGKSGSVEQPQLHFELRKNSKPVDPLPHLSGA